MKVRLISSAVAIVIALIVIAGIFTPVFPLFLSFLSVVAAWEIMKAVGVKSNLIIIPAEIFSAVIPVYAQVSRSLPFDIPEGAVLTLYVIMMLGFMLKTHKKTKFEQLAITLYASIFVPYAFSGLITIRDVFVTYESVYTKAEAIYLIFFALLCSFLTDSFAYFVGRKFGKHKMAPVISPKKSVEGAIGGLVLSVAFNVAVFAGVRYWAFGGKTAISFVFVIVMSVLLAAISMLGDLTASLLKRNYGIKDFGKIMPGHGGVMDRFDSLVFVVPVLAAGIKFINM
ncbi:MAG: hypothetical protein E7536_10850 [Ruminococcaceae bacterium]|nr:hypothetical protein [Oscillospiraceae bacterium]